MYAKSFLNYPGGKYKIIKYLLHYFPNHVNTFIDLFAGSSVVNENYNGAYFYLANDLNKPLIDLQRYILKIGISKFESQVNSIISHYQLSNTYKYGYKHYHIVSSKGLSKLNQPHYLKLRSDFNNQKIFNSKYAMLYTLIVYGFNNQIRFNKHFDFNNPVGKRDWNQSMRKKLEDFYIIDNTKNIRFTHKDFSQIPISSEDFVYADPPYSITTAVYNDNSGWNATDDLRLFKYLDHVDHINAKFALSDVLVSKGKVNKPLIKWSKKYNIHHINKSYNNSSYHTCSGKTDECLITNYAKTVGIPRLKAIGSKFKYINN